MTVDYGYGELKHRESAAGQIEPVGLAIGRSITITLHFLQQRAGELVTVAPLDGGTVDVQAPIAISSDGTVVFHFQAGLSPGLYRLAVGGAGQYQLSLYALDPRELPVSARGSADR
jgi:hypothetical protein